MDVDAYLRRIGHSATVACSPDGLRALHRAHLLSVPFENLSIHGGDPIVLDDDSLFQKVVVQRRGGFCYELNGLFAALLRAMGFDVAMVSAGVMGSSGEFGPDFDHMALIVTAGDRWLVDVGFGDSFLEPLRLDEPDRQVDPAGVFRVAIDASGHWLLGRYDATGVPRPQYRFTEHPRAYADYAEMCRYHQTSPESPFTRQRLVTLATPDGRVTLGGMKFVETRGGTRHERELRDRQEYMRVLRDTFGVVEGPDGRPKGDPV